MPTRPTTPLLTGVLFVAAAVTSLAVGVGLVGTITFGLIGALLGAAIGVLGVKALLLKLLQLVGVLLVVTFFTFMLIRLLPGEPEDLLVPLATNGTNEEAQRVVLEKKAEIREDLGLDDPLFVQYVRWLGDFVTGDLGNEYTVSSTRPVSDKVSDSLPPSIQLIVYSQIIALLIAIPAGVITAYKQNSFGDRVANATAFGLLSLPNFAVGLLLAYWVGVRSSLPINPQGYTELTADPTAHFQQMILPAISLALGQIAVYMRLLRSDMIQTLQEDFILMAKSKGVSSSRVLWRHALRPSSLTLLTVAGLNIGTLIGGTVVIEVIFGIPGMGSLIAEAILRRQYVMLQSLVAIVAIGFVLINAVLDIVYSVLDPRIRNVRA